MAPPIATYAPATQVGTFGELRPGLKGFVEGLHKGSMRAAQGSWAAQVLEEFYTGSGVQGLG